MCSAQLVIIACVTRRSHRKRNGDKFALGPIWMILHEGDMDPTGELQIIWGHGEVIIKSINHTFQLVVGGQMID